MTSSGMTHMRISSMLCLICSDASRAALGLTLRLRVIDEDAGQSCKIHMAGRLDLHIELLHASTVAE